MHLSQLAEIYFIPRLNLSSVVSLDQASGMPRYTRVCPCICSIHAAQLSSHVVYSTDCSVEIKMLFNTDANRCPVFYASLSAGYTRARGWLVECQNDAHIVALKCNVVHQVPF